MAELKRRNPYGDILAPQFPPEEQVKDTAFSSLSPTPTHIVQADPSEERDTTGAGATHVPKPPPEPTQALHVQVPRRLHLALKRLALDRDTTMQALVVQALEDLCGHKASDSLTEGAVQH